MSGNLEERPARALSGWLALPLWLGGAAVAAWQVVGPIATRGAEPAVIGILLIPLLVFLLKGFLVLQPNQAAVMVFFGNYAGSLREDGFFWVNPFFAKTRVSLRAHNLNTPTLKV
ncbi:MAG: SPFH domain-containing protein, partial [Gammaproteobacteria bacterium]